ncbi:MAG: mannosyl-3-phosphoglycerate phosphatase, partial [Actinobacteria bacterium]|nr:mannosyl-3-phosphoglycerate phosphatase [Actinomycetota bacterium]NIY12617.1 mannosyl-3-phosphoglycerate phosphatase [Gemmatimonadota bacterium]NIS36524.1 mannosyl-3-phosphoglycerate phosphatase [Actinomycetota bacterium]NIT98755.1 mannosyl-3-phosphoglycerate phosphatase [Actinomycetota bacterium]NIU22381.1 mannosyl-3-phosphoglycerate phosphatase [Actinomycetota bacterium]
DDETVRFGLPFEMVRSGLEEAARRAGIRVRGYADMTPDEIADRTGLPPGDAALAADRRHSETFLVLDGDGDSLRPHLHVLGLTLVRGSRFLTVQGRHDKGTAVPVVAARTGATRTFAVGDAGNDEGMLRAVDVGMLVRSHDGSHVEMEVPGLVRLDGVGPEGWVEA